MGDDSTVHWVEKYRPSALDEVVSQDHIVSTLNRLIDGKRLPHLLFYGPPGTGKTTTILACARRLYGDNYKSMVLELNASDDRGIGVVREQIKTFASTRKIFSSGVKLIILDEADNMENTAQAALRRVIERYTKNTRFCLICNYVNRIIPALQSRCMRFRFGPLKRGMIVGRLSDIAAKENVNLSESAMDALMDLGRGDMRRCLNIMQAASMSTDHVDADALYTCTGNPRPSDIESMLKALLNSDFKDAYEAVVKIKEERGLALGEIVTELHKFVMVTECPEVARRNVYIRLADIEHRLAMGGDELVQLGSLVGVFQFARADIVKYGTPENGSNQQGSSANMVIA